MNNKQYIELITEPYNSLTNISEERLIIIALKNLSDYIKKSVLNPKDDEMGVLYYTLPMWHYNLNMSGATGTWLKDYPMEFADKVNKEQYCNFFEPIRNGIIKFSISEFIATILKKVPVFFEINFNEDDTNFSVNNLYPCTLSLNVPKSRLCDYKDLDNIKYKESLFDFIETFKDVDFYDNNSLHRINVLKEFYKFLYSYKSNFVTLAQVLVISSKLYTTKDGRDVSFGGLIIALSKRVNILKPSEEMMGIYNLSFIVNLKYRELAFDNWINKLNQEHTKEAIKSAVSAIMARNMSHNLGSHFISNTKNYFGQLADEDNDDQRKKDYRGIKHTLQYIQERMDFIATIVSSDRFPYGPVNVKSQIFDELTPDEFGLRHGKATTNFLLDFLVYSEEISKSTNERYGSNKTRLTLDLITKEGNTLYRFGAVPKSEDKEAREVFAKKNLAVPGGILGRHAIFTIIENIIRNSSKHDKGRIPSTGLNVSVRLNIDDDNASNLIIFDNKGNAEKVKKTIIELFQETQILEENGSIDKGNKGLKEILIATLWLNNVNLSCWLAKYDSLKNDKKGKLEMLGQYLEILSVNSNGEENITAASHLGYKIKIKPFKPVYLITPSEKKFILYKDIADVNADIVAADEDYFVLINEDESIIENITPKLSTVFPRFVLSNDGNDPVSLMKKSLENRGLVKIDDLDRLSVDIVPDNQKGRIKPINKPNKYNIHSSDNDIVKPLEVDIIYKSHLSVNEKEIRNSLDRYPNAKYIDSISGGNFTHTLTEEFFLEDELNRLKIIESALCKIVIVDERIFNNYAHGQMSQEKTQEIIVSNSRIDEIMSSISELKKRGESLVRIAGEIEDRYVIKLSSTDLLSEDLVGCIHDTLQKKFEQPGKAETEVTCEYNNYHEFLKKRGIYIYNILPATGEIIPTDGLPVKLNSDVKVVSSPTFFSIHLSLIEGLIKERQLVDPVAEKSSIIREMMDNLRARFGDPKFIMVHSGRGNLSKELEEELKDKAFMSLSAIEASLYDSKYFLTQLLCSNCYFGKGKMNL